MTIGTRLIQERLIQADLLVYQAVVSTPVASTPVVLASMDLTVTGGLLRMSPVPTHGYVHYTPTTKMSTETPAIETPAFLLVASGIKN